MKKGDKTRLRLLTYILVVTLIMTSAPEFFFSMASAAESAWKVVQSPTSVIEEIYCFDGENYVGGKGDNAYREDILADKDMNVLFQGSGTEPLMLFDADYTTCDQRDYYGDCKSIDEKFSGYYQIQEEDTDGNTWRGIIDKSGREIIPMKQDIDFYSAHIGSDGLIYFCAPNNGNVCYNTEGKKVLSKKIVLQSDYIKEKFPNADSVSFDYNSYNGYVVLFIQMGRREDRVYFELKGNILDYPVSKEIVWKHCELNTTNSDKTDYGKKISSCLKKYLGNEEEKVVSMLRAEGIVITDGSRDRNLEYFQMPSSVG